MKITAVACRSGNWWAIRIPEVDGAYTQARRLDQVPAMAADAAAMLSDIDPAEIEVTVQSHTDADEAIERAKHARAIADDASDQASRFIRDAAKELLDEKLTVRDVGHLLGVSPQRVSQITHDLVDA